MAYIVDRMNELQKEFDQFLEGARSATPEVLTGAVSNVFLFMKLAELEEKVNSILNRPETLI